MTDPTADGASRPARTASSRIGQTLGGRYKLQSVLGTGGMGAVYAAQDAATGRAAAVKTLLPELAESPEIRSRLPGRFTLVARSSSCARPCWAWATSQDAASEPVHPVRNRHRLCRCHLARLRRRAFPGRPGAVFRVDVRCRRAFALLASGARVRSGSRHRSPSRGSAAVNMVHRAEAERSPGPSSS